MSGNDCDYTTFRSYPISDLDLDDEDKQQLRDRVAHIEDVVSEEYASSIEELEEGPPSIRGNLFEPGGWVGEFAPGVVVKPEHFDDDAFEKLITEVQDWSEILGPDTITAAFQFSPDLLLDQKARLGPYSNALQTQTDQVLSHRLPVDVKQRTERHPEPRGRVRIQETLREQARHSNQIVSQRTEFRLDSLENLILVRFHAELARELRRLTQQHQYYMDLLGDRLAYHRSVLDQPLFDQLLEKGLDEPLATIETIDEARRGADEDFMLIIDLWESFLRNINLELAFTEHYNTAVKPMSKVYEVWVLRRLLESVADIEGVEPNIGEIAGTYSIGDYTVHYNQSPNRPNGVSGTDVSTPFTSRYFEPNLGRSVGDPDFVIDYDGETIWVGDAKYKNTPSVSDVRQVLGYAVDLIDPNIRGDGVLFYPGTQRTGRDGLIREYHLLEKPLHPQHVLGQCEEVEKQLTAIQK
jgi:hypothetical protein